MYKCPKCGGTDLYRGKKQVEFGYGLTRYSKEELRSFCRKCDIEAVYYSSGYYSSGFDWDNVGAFILYGGLFAVLLFIGWVWSSAGFPLPF
jgi:hypothetical protein